MKASYKNIVKELSKRLGQPTTINELVDIMFNRCIDLNNNTARGYFKRLAAGGIVTQAEDGAHPTARFTEISYVLEQSGVDALPEWIEKAKADVDRKREAANKRLVISRKAVRASAEGKTRWSKRALMSGVPGTTSKMMERE